MIIRIYGDETKSPNSSLNRKLNAMHVKFDATAYKQEVIENKVKPSELDCNTRSMIPKFRELSEPNYSVALLEIGNRCGNTLLFPTII